MTKLAGRKRGAGIAPSGRHRAGASLHQPKPALGMMSASTLLQPGMRLSANPSRTPAGARSTPFLRARGGTSNRPPERPDVRARRSSSSPDQRALAASCKWADVRQQRLPSSPAGHDGHECCGATRDASQRPSAPARCTLAAARHPGDHLVHGRHRGRDGGEGGGDHLAVPEEAQLAGVSGLRRLTANDTARWARATGSRRAEPRPPSRRPPGRGCRCPRPPVRRYR